MNARSASGLQSIGITAEGKEYVRALCAVQPQADGSAPEWIQIMPFGPQVKSRDGRAFQVSDVIKVAASTELPLLVDWEHASETPGMFGGTTRAAGWIEELKVEHDSAAHGSAGLFGRVEWTKVGAEDVGHRAYRFLSPVLVLDAESRDVETVLSVALTNRPALSMEGIRKDREKLSARFGLFHDAPEAGEKGMNKDELKLLCSALGIEGEADPAKILASAKEAVSTRAGLNTQVVQLSLQVQEKDAEIATLTTKVAEAGKAAFANEVKLALDEASKAGKVSPGLRVGFEAMCATRDGFENFSKNILPNLPVLGAAAPASQPGKSGSPRHAHAFTQKQRDGLKEKGLTDAQIDEAIADINKSRGKTDADDEED